MEGRALLFSLSWRAGCPHYCQSTSGLAVPGSCTALCPLSALPALACLPACLPDWLLPLVSIVRAPQSVLEKPNYSPPATKKTGTEKGGGWQRRITSACVRRLLAPRQLFKHGTRTSVQDLCLKKIITRAFFFSSPLCSRAFVFLLVEEERVGGGGWKGEQRHARKVLTPPTCASTRRSKLSVALTSP